MTICPVCGKVQVQHSIISSEGRAFHLYFLPFSRNSSLYCWGHEQTTSHPLAIKAEETGEKNWAEIRQPVPRAFYEAFAGEDEL
jgi:hypothetical protein